MPRAVASAVVVALVCVGVAVAGRGDPQKRIVPADQARAKAMLLRAADVPGATVRPASPEADFYCRALDESDLTLTGDARSPDFQIVFAFVSSYAQVYESPADANASWRRGTSAAGERCLRRGFQQELRRSGDTLLSIERIAAPRVAQRSVAFRVVGETQGVRVYIDAVALMQSRAHAGIVLGSPVRPVPKAERDRLTRLVAARMKKAMRGA